MLTEWLQNIWPMDEPLCKRILILCISIIHLLIVIFIFTGWALIPPSLPLLQLFYIGLIFACIFLYICLNGCILTFIRKACYSQNKDIKNISIMPNVGKRYLIAAWLILLILGLHNYYNPKYSFFNLLFKN